MTVVSLHAPFDPTPALTYVATADPVIGEAMRRVGPVVRLAANRRVRPSRCCSARSLTSSFRARQRRRFTVGSARSIPERDPLPRGWPPRLPRRSERLASAEPRRWRSSTLRPRRSTGRCPPALRGCGDWMRRRSSTRLTAVRGVGRWTVEMFLMFRLGRPDVLPATDLGIQKGFAVALGRRAPADPGPVAAQGRALASVADGGQLVPLVPGRPRPRVKPVGSQCRTGRLDGRPVCFQQLPRRDSNPRQGD